MRLDLGSAMRHPRDFHTVDRAEDRGTASRAAAASSGVQPNVTGALPSIPARPAGRYPHRDENIRLPCRDRRRFTVPWWETSSDGWTTSPDDSPR
jgi:hypothetical protein